ncbi:hypothetical protein F2P56_001918 [Juglans regia]|uniref:Reverse transcriptase Ty1/copia-type domain-containing protein n=1 Tax=Juglans regia TaxID=51240 RepID=A0A834D8T1_JUGRE|nr:hypothetical protein F2P56_001918 [Juglans regia]
MFDELKALYANNTWTLVPRESSMDVIGCKWIFKTKLNADGTLDRLKARLVAKGFHQIAGINYHEAFSPVIRPSTIRTIITIALIKHWDIRQLNVKNAFLHGVQITQTLDGLTLTQEKYAHDTLDRAQMSDCKPKGTPMMAKTKGLKSTTPYSNLAHYCSLVGALQYLTLTRPDLAYNVNFIGLDVHSPNSPQQAIVYFLVVTIFLG